MASKGRKVHCHNTHFMLCYVMLCNVCVMCRVAMVLCVGMLARVNSPLCWDVGYVTCRNGSLCGDVSAGQ